MRCERQEATGSKKQDIQPNEKLVSEISNAK